MALFKADKKAPKGPAGKWDVVIGEDMCKACGFCLNVCPTDVFAYRTAANRIGWFPMYVAARGELRRVQCSATRSVRTSASTSRSSPAPARAGGHARNATRGTTDGHGRAHPAAGRPGRALDRLAAALSRRPPPARGGHLRAHRGRHRRRAAASSPAIPITPATDIAEYMSKRLPQVGGYYMQCEDELAGMHTCAGASLGGPQGDDGDLGARLHAHARRVRLGADQRDPAGRGGRHAGGADQRHHRRAGAGGVLRRALLHARRQLRDDRALALARCRRRSG